MPAKVLTQYLRGSFPTIPTNISATIQARSPLCLRALEAAFEFRQTLTSKTAIFARAVSFRIQVLILLAVLMPALARSQSKEEGLRILVVDTQAEAQSALTQLQNGANFGELAKKISTDITAPDGGYMGIVDPAQLRPELRDALQGVAAGHLSAIIHLPSGYAILQVLPPGEHPQIKTSATPSATVNATGSIRYPPNAGGKSEADLAFRTLPKQDGWQQDLKGMCKIRQDSLSMVTDQLLHLLDPSSPDTVLNKAPLDALQMRYALANVYAYQGIMDKAIAQWEAAYELASSKLPPAMPELEAVLGISYLHKSEMSNDVYRHPADRCIWPPAKASAFAKVDDSEKALAYLQKYLARHPEALDMRWLLNVTYATLGKYPDGVPQEFLIPPDVFGASTDPNIPRFHDVAEKAGIHEYDMSGGLIVDDFENNGLLDIVTSDYGQCAPMHYFHNNGDGTFTDRTEKAGLAGQLGGLNMVQADYNNDGCVDIFVDRGAWEFPQRPSLLRNNCDGTFTDVTKQAGLDLPNQSQAVVFADIDNDGYLDLFIGNEAAPSHLYRNKGDGTFEDVSHKAGIDRTAYTKAVVAADYDNDGYVDFYLSNLDGNNFLYHNNHNGTFTEVAEKAGVQKPSQSFPAWFFDYDNDGWPDIFVASYYVSPDESIRSYVGAPHNAETLKLYRNNHDGTFKDVTTEVGLDRVFMPMGSNFGDIDNDGYLDIYLGTGNPVYASLLPNVMLHNEQGKRFVDVTAASGTGELHKGHGVAFADVARNGNEDLLEEVGGAVLGDAHAFRLFENPGTGKNWINLKLIGTKTNRSAVGARIKVTVEESGHPRSIYRTVGSGGSFGASPLEQHIGLGTAQKVSEIEIWWPATGKRQHFTNVAVNQFLEIKESDANFRRLDYHAVKLGGTK